MIKMKIKKSTWDAHKKCTGKERKNKVPNC